MEQRFEIFTTQIAKISRYIRKIKTEEISEYGLKSPHVSCLYYMFKQGGKMTAKELCEICDEDKASISRSLDYLEKNEFLISNSKTEKKYKCPLVLTDKGHKMGEIIANKIDGILSDASKGLSEENRKIFYESLMLISDNLNKICEKYDD